MGSWQGGGDETLSLPLDDFADTLLRFADIGIQPGDVLPSACLIRASSKHFDGFLSPLILAGVDSLDEIGCCKLAEMICSCTLVEDRLYS